MSWPASTLMRRVRRARPGRDRTGNGIRLGNGIRSGNRAGSGAASGMGPGPGTGSAPGSDDGSGSDGPEVPAPVQHQTGPATGPLDALVACFGLTAFERDLVLLTAAYELDATTAARCAAASGDPERAYPTFSLALAALAEPHWSALTPVAPLRRWRIVELDDESRLTLSRLRLDERILHFLLGSPYLDARLHGQLRRTPVPDELPPSYDLAASRVAAGWTTGARPDAPLLVEVVGGDLRSRADIAAAAAARSGLGLYSMSAEDIPTDPAERDRLARLWQREAILLPAALLVEVGELDRDQHAATDAFLAGAAVPVVVSSADPRRTDRPHGERVAVPRLDDEEQLGLWAGAFEDVADIGEGELRSLVAQFQLPPHVVRAAAAAVRRDLPGEDELDAGRARLACRNERGPDRHGRAGPPYRARTRAGTTSCCTSGRRVCCARSSRTCGSGQPSTRSGGSRRPCAAGSASPRCSRAARAPARRSPPRSWRRSSASTSSSSTCPRWSASTSARPRRTCARSSTPPKRGGALLLFDEADALFGKRSEVKDSHDRYANLEVSYLLMRMEAYRGLAILTTNMKKALDTAFLRRIRFVVDFPFPAEHERAEIWRRVLPPQTPTKGIEPELLAQLTVAGGSIRNIARPAPSSPPRRATGCRCGTCSRRPAPSTSSWSAP